MTTFLEGGCCVSEMREGVPTSVGALRLWNRVGTATGAKAISLRILEFGPGVSSGLRNRDSDEVLYLLERLDGLGSEGSCSVCIDGHKYEVGPQTGIYLRPGQTLSIENPGPEKVVFVSSQCPQPTAPDAFVEPPIRTLEVAGETPPIVRLDQRRAISTADRWYRVLVDDEIGSKQVTQFVGSIPPGRAPDHFHHYEEVLFILRGTGRMWAGETSAPIHAGSCIYLPERQIHCVENAGPGELRLLGVFYPAGSPAVRYET